MADLRAGDLELIHHGLHAFGALRQRHGPADLVPAAHPATQHHATGLDLGDVDPTPADQPIVPQLVEHSTLDRRAAPPPEHVGDQTASRTGEQEAGGECPQADGGREPDPSAEPAPLRFPFLRPLRLVHPSPALGTFRFGAAGTRLRGRGIPAFVATLAVLGAAACGDAGAGPAEGPDLDALFAAPTAAELAAVEADWATRDPAPVDVRLESTQRITLGFAPATVRVLSHAITGGRHYGAVVTVDGAAPRSLPVLVYLHGGDDGVAVSDLLLLSLALGEAVQGFMWVLPSFRGEALATAGASYRSGGQPSPWDRDVDDAIALLGAALATTPAADPERVGALGFSRGGGVALLMGIRDPRVDRVVDFFGPTDFFGPYIREVVEQALDGELRPLPGLDVIDQRFIQPFGAGSLPLAQARLELARRSAVLFAADLPTVQIHHGTADDVVEVSQAESLIRALQALGRGTPATADESYLYAGAGHDPLAMAGSVGRATRFLAGLGAQK